MCYNGVDAQADGARRHRGTEAMDMDRRFTALRIIGTIMKILAWTALILGFLLAILVLILGIALDEPLGMLDVNLEGALLGVAGFVILLLLAVLSFLFLYGFGEFLFVFLSIEESARRVAYIQQQEYAASVPVFPPTPVIPDFE
jgi:hypothetical protein